MDRDPTPEERAQNARRKNPLSEEQLRRAVNQTPARRKPGSAEPYRQRGEAATNTMKGLFEQKGHSNIRTEVVPGSRAGGRVDLIPGTTTESGDWNPTTRATIESKSVDIDKYRTDTGELDVPKLRKVFRDHFEQVRKHINALKSPRKADLPSREAIVYQLEGEFTPEEFKTVRKVFNEESRALPKRIRGGVHSGKALRAKLGGVAEAQVEVAPTDAPVAPVEGPTPISAGLRGAAAIAGGALAVLNVFAVYLALKRAIEENNTDPFILMPRLLGIQVVDPNDLPSERVYDSFRGPGTIRENPDGTKYFEPDSGCLFGGCGSPSM
jgi:hypothetical protein